MRLRELAVGARVGLSCLVLVLLGGLAASGAHLYQHYQNRDELAGLTMDDLRGAYHGVDRRAPLLTALEAGHPEGLPTADRDVLTRWLNGARISEDYDSIDLGDAAPVEIVARNCLSCHTRRVIESGATNTRLALDSFDDVKRVAFSRVIRPTDTKVLVASAHAHTISMATLSLVVAFLMWCTRWPTRVRSATIGVTGVALLLDLASWWLAREAAGFVWLVVLGGLAYSITTALMLVAVLAEMWLPDRNA
ncbi:MAG: hypothetical protein ACKVX7_09825 [Planctomycetota bacterium]